MATWVWILIAIIAVIAVALVAGMAAVRRRTVALRQHFGAEYDRTVRSREDRRAAEADLRARQRQRARLMIRPLPEPTRIRFIGEWRGVQEGFVDHPAQAVTSADSLVKRVMEARGYPEGDFEELACLVSVDHPEAVEDYRLAHGVRERAAMQRASTEDLRQAMLLYRSLFHELIQPDGAETSDIAGRPNTRVASAGVASAGGASAGVANAGGVIAGPGTAGRRTGAIAVPGPRPPIAMPAGPRAGDTTRPRAAGTGTARPSNGTAGPGAGSTDAREDATRTANGGGASARPVTGSGNSATSGDGASRGNGTTAAPPAGGAGNGAGEAEDTGPATRTSRWAGIGRQAGVDDERR